MNNLHLNRYLYGGNEYQDAMINGSPLGLYDFHARYYNPILGRWFNMDPAMQTANPYIYCGNSPMMYVDENGEFFFSLFLGPLGAVLDAACWGAVIGGAGYTASVAMSPGGFQNWNWGQFGSSVGWGAISGAVTFGIGEAFSAAGNFAGKIGTKALQGVAHGLSQGSLSALQGGDFWSGAASGMLGSWAASGYEMSGLGDKLGKAGMYGFGGLSGGIGSVATGGNFWQGAANGLIVTGLNHLQHQVQSTQQENKAQKTLEKYNNYVKNGNSVSLPISLTNYFTKEEIAWLVKAGKITKVTGAVTTLVDATLTINAIYNGQSYAEYLYNTVIGVGSLCGPIGAVAAPSLDFSVKGVTYTIKMGHEAGRRMQADIMSKICF